MGPDLDIGPESEQQAGNKRGILMRQNWQDLNRLDTRNMREDRDDHSLRSQGWITELSCYFPRERTQEEGEETLIFICRP